MFAEMPLDNDTVNQCTVFVRPEGLLRPVEARLENVTRERTI
jgi:hypothetical protein